MRISWKLIWRLCDLALSVAGLLWLNVRIGEAWYLWLGAGPVAAVMLGGGTYYLWNWEEGGFCGVLTFWLLGAIASGAAPGLVFLANQFFGGSDWHSLWIYPAYCVAQIVFLLLGGGPDDSPVEAVAKA